MTSLGFTTNVAPIKKKTRTHIGHENAKPDIVETSTTYTKRSTIITNPKFLVFFNLVLACTHFSIVVYISFTEFRFPLTFFETRINEELIDNVTCIYDFGENVFTNSTNSYCSNPLYTQSGNYTPTAECQPVLDGLSSTPGVSDTGGPLLSAYSLTRFGQGNNTNEYIDDVGRVLAKAVLLTIEGVTTFAHIIYAFIISSLHKSNVKKYIVSNGGLPVRWIEYAITSSLMSLIIANVSNLFEFFGVLSIALSTFSLMFFGFLIEYLCVQGKIQDALMILYIPGLAVFMGTWVPIVLSLTTSVFELSCLSHDTSNIFYCETPSCFGREVPIFVFSFALFVMFCVFPIILIYKIYAAGEYSKYLDISNRVPKIPFVASFVVYFVDSIKFTVFIFVAGFIAWFKLFDYILGPILPFHFIKIQERTVSPISLDKILYCEFLYAIGSLISKVFLAIFFTLNFSGREW